VVVAARVGRGTRWVLPASTRPARVRVRVKVRVRARPASTRPARGHVHGHVYV
jgi:hypothetical protein